MTKRSRKLWSLIAVLILGVTAPVGTAQQGHSPVQATPGGDATPQVEQGAPWRVGEVTVVDIEGAPVTMSPDARWLAGLGPDRELCVWELATMEATCDEASADIPINADSMIWSPDGSAIAFTEDAFMQGYESDIHLFDLAVGESVNLTDDGLEGGLFSHGDASSMPVDVTPTWTGDSQSIIFARSDLALDSAPTDLMTISRAGGEPELLATVHDAPISIYTRMYILSDGSLLYTLAPSDVSDSATGLWVLSPGGEARQVLPGSGSSDYPIPIITSVFEGNGTVLVAAYSAYNRGQFPSELPVAFIADLGSGVVTPLEGDPETFQTPGPAVLSPDGAAYLAVMLGPVEGDQAVLVGEQREEVELGPGGQSSFRAPPLRGGPEWRAGETVFISGGLLGDPYILTLTQDPSA